ncbi:MAG: helix-turn-helix domain-containing protein [Bacteroidales bacterium]
MYNLEEHITFYLIPKETMDELLEAIQDLRALRTELGNGSREETLGDYIPEEKAMELLQRGKTWFWNMRKNKKLAGKKAGNRWYYRLETIKKFVENGKY